MRQSRRRDGGAARWISRVLLLFATGLGGPLLAQPDELRQEESFDVRQLSLEDLLEVEIEVISVFRTTQPRFTTPAAIDIIKNDDIRRSGAQELQDVLRIVPGMNVARVNRGLWSISARGFNDRFSDNLLIQRDGRSIYSSIYAATIWEAQDFFLEDIEQLEIIRGPGASVWGSNAVNGIINIVSKSAFDTHGTLLKATYESTGPGSIVFRHGAPIDENWSFHVRAKAAMRDGYPLFDGGSSQEDSWNGLRAGFRGSMVTSTPKTS